MHRTVRVGLVVACSLACTTACVAGPDHPPRAPASEADLTWDEVLELAGARDYFGLRERLAEGGASHDAALYAQAVVRRAFNDPAASNVAIRGLLDGGAQRDSVARELRRLAMTNHLRLFEYGAGLAAADALLADTGSLPPERVREVENMRRILEALADVPPQTSEIRGSSEVPVERGHIPVVVNDSTRRYMFDTGANLSTIMRSEADALGMRVLPAGIDVGTATDRRIVADLAVADRLRIGQVHYRNVVFLVLDDELLTFPGGFRIPGIIGFPVIEAMGEVRVTRAGALQVPERAPARAEGNLALHDLTLLTRLTWEDAELLCQLDTGADQSVMYQPVLRRHRERVEAAGETVTHRWGGAGGLAEMPAYLLRGAELGVGGTRVVLDSLFVLRESIAPAGAQDVLDCNLGRDVLEAFSQYVLNFDDMAFLLR